MHYYQFNIGDYASHTRHLSLLEDLAYRKLLDHYYLHEQPLNACVTSVARLIGMREYQTEVEAVLQEFFTLTEEGWIQTRADKEISHYKAKIQQASNAGKASAQRRSNARSTDVQPNNNQEPVTNKHKPVKNKNSVATPDGFTEFWLAYPKKVGKGAAESAWKKLNPPLKTCLALIELNKVSQQWLKDGGQFIPNPSTWINQRRWEDGAPKCGHSFDSVDYGQSGSL